MDFSERVDHEIVQRVREEWDERNRPLLISQLGSRLSSEVKAILSSSGRGLKRYIQENLEGSVRIVPMRSRGGGVAPVDTSSDLSDGELEELFSSRSAPSEGSAVPMYWGDVWRGFQKPVPEGSVRYILFDATGKPEVIDAPADAAHPTNAKLIGQGDVVLASEDEIRPPRSAVHQAIENWSLREGVPVGSLEFKRSTSSRRAESSTDAQRRSTSSVHSNRAGTASLMHGLDVLSHDELKRINIPADLVLAMIERLGSR